MKTIFLLLLCPLLLFAQKNNYQKVQQYMDRQAEINRFGGTVIVMKMISYGLSGILFNIPVEIPYVHTSVKIDDHLLKKYEGQFQNIEILISKNSLFLNNLDTELVPESNTKFFRKDNPDRTFEFITDKKGNINSIITTKGGVSETKKRNRKSTKNDTVKS